jgi:hypothetical protein
MHARFHTQHTEPSLGTVERHALDDAGEHTSRSVCVAGDGMAMGKIIPHTPGVWRARVERGGLMVRPGAHGDRFEAFGRAKLGAEGYQPSGCAIRLGH